MGRNVVCVSATWGSGAREIAGRVARALGFRLIDEEILLRAAAEAGVDPGVVADVEHRKSLLARLLHGLGSAADGVTVAVAGGPITTADMVTDEDLRNLIRAAIEETATEGNVVIVAHGASVALAGREDVLRVLVTAPPDTRSKRHAAEHSVGEAEAAQEIADSDAERADYLKRFYGIHHELPTHYDLVVNTDRLAAAQAADVIVCAAAAT